jgi:tripartite-type tricarboxylate transporter receptor subunit TctC
MADTMTRLICKVAEKDLGQPILCENRAGAGGVVGVSYVLKSKPDGYILGASTNGPFTISPHMEKVPYNPLTDVTGIMVYFKYTHALCVRADAPWNTFEEVLAYAKQNPGKFTYGSAGVGVPQQIVMERIAMKEGIKWSYVPFKSGAEPVIACLGGHIHAATQGPADVVSHIEAGKLKLLLPLNDVRWPIAPKVPAVSEKYGFFGFSVQGVYGPKGMPEHIREKLENVFKKAMNDPSYVEAAKALNVVVTYMSGKDFEKICKSEHEAMGKVIRAMGLAK